MADEDSSGALGSKDKVDGPQEDLVNNNSYVSLDAIPAYPAPSVPDKLVEAQPVKIVAIASNSHSVIAAVFLNFSHMFI